jgi:hypothetical protein
MTACLAELLEVKGNELSRLTADRATRASPVGDRVGGFRWLTGWAILGKVNLSEVVVDVAST